MKYVFDNFELDTATRELCRSGVIVAIEPQVFALLRFLIENRERVVLKQEILDAVWSGRIISDAALSSRIKAARQALGDDGKTQACIKTMHGAGFRFLKTVRVVGAPPYGATLRHERNESRVSIVVMPFRTISTDPAHAVLADAVHADLNTQLARVKDYLVMSRTTAFINAEPPSSPQELGRALAVDYVIEGSLRPHGDMVRLSALIIDASNGACIAALKFDRPIVALLDLQNSVITEIVRHLGSEINLSEVRRLEERAFAKPSAFDNFRRAKSTMLIRGWKPSNLFSAIALLEEAIAIDPGFAPALAMLALFNGLTIKFRLIADECGARVKQVVAWSHQSIDMDGQSSDVLGYAGCALCDVGYIDEGVYHLERAVKLDPSNDQAHAALGWGRFLQGRFEEGLAIMSEAIRISPNYPGQAFWLYGLAFGYVQHNHVEEAIQTLNEALMIDPDFVGAYYMLADISFKQGDRIASKHYLKRARRIKASS